MLINKSEFFKLVEQGKTSRNKVDLDWDEIFEACKTDFTDYAFTMRMFYNGYVKGRVTENTTRRHLSQMVAKGALSVADYDGTNYYFWTEYLK